jgi:hypothetical protein
MASRSAIRMVQMFINRAGKSLDADQKEELEKGQAEVASQAKTLQGQSKVTRPTGVASRWTSGGRRALLERELQA